MWRLSLLLCFLPISASAGIVLNEVYYDHDGRDDGYEFIELFNGAGVAHALVGYRLEFHDGAGTGWRVIWRADIADSIPGEGHFTVGGSRVVPVPDARRDFSLQNGPDAVRLVRPDGSEDRLGYGPLGDPQYFESAPAPDVAEGLALVRVPDGFDTDDNASDFHALAPSPGRFNRPRRDVAIARPTATPARRVVAPGLPETVGFRLANVGIHPVRAGEVWVELVDSTAAGIDLVGRWVLDADLDPDASRDGTLGYTPMSGYHWLVIRVDYGPDERSSNDAFVLVRRAGTPALLVSEVMSRPAPGCPEYVEIYNATGAPYDLTNHRIRDRVGEPAVIDGQIVPPGAFRVLTADKQDLVRCHPRVPPDATAEVHERWPTLNHTGSGLADSVLILDAFGLPVDRVGFPPQGSDHTGYSLERVDLYPGERPHVWALGPGTPGAPGQRSLLDRPRSPGLRVTPNPFDPLSGETLVVTVAGDVGMHVRVSVFDLDGRRRHTMGAAAAEPFVFVWDGRDANGRPMDTGVYVITSEWVDPSTGRRWVDKVVLGCGRKTTE